MITNLQPVTEVKRRATELIAELQATRQPMLITQHGRAAAVMMDIESYEAMQRRMEIMMLLSQSRQDLAEGRGRTQDQVAERLGKKYRAKP
jgi:prevent-host-death family protein